MVLACPVKRASVYPFYIASGDPLPMPPSPPIRSTSIGCSGLFSEGDFNWDVLH